MSITIDGTKLTSDNAYITLDGTNVILSSTNTMYDDINCRTRILTALNNGIPLDFSEFFGLGDKYVVYINKQVCDICTTLDLSVCVGEYFTHACSFCLGYGSPTRGNQILINGSFLREFFFVSSCSFFMIILTNDYLLLRK